MKVYISASFMFEHNLIFTFNQIATLTLTSVIHKVGMFMYGGHTFLIL